MDDLVALEERLAHLTRAVEEMSDEMARQGREIDVLTRRVALLLQREAEREAMEGGLGAIPLADQKPPHW
ncbi:SlyX family protein [Gemmobacter caeruleus]|uniref:SlyX family protein n=1 Tax=Gemmobacter caeruleus TaxID=2595004 RepID=UPI0011EF7997|nr:SlyX family protein [Gemmobacter caeruleus]